MTRLFKNRSKSDAWFIIAGMVTIATLLTSCDAGKPDTLTDNGEVKLTLRLSLPEAEEDIATRTITSNEESAIDIAQLKVLAFKVNGASEVFAYETPQVQLEGGKYKVTLRQSTAGEKYRLVVIANTGNKLPSIPKDTPKSDALKMITFSASGNWNATGTAAYTHFPMWGETTATQTIVPTTSLGNITLLRALARLDVGCALTEETAAGISGFILKSVSVYRTRNKGYAAPVNAGTITGNVVATVSIPADAGTNDALTYACKDGKALVREIYMAEAQQGSSKDNNVCLVIGGIYGGTINYYRVDLTNAGSYIPIKRNCRYIVNVTAVSNEGYTTEADAMTGDKTLVISTNISAEPWGNEYLAGSENITL